MNESDLEEELGRWKPAEPSASLEHRIAAALRRQGVPTAAPRPRWTLLGWWLDRLVWGGAGAVAVLALLLATQPSSTSVRDASPAQAVTAAAAAATYTAPLTVAAASPAPLAVPATDSGLLPVLASDETSEWQDDGVTFDQSGQPVLKLRRVAVEHQAWADPQNAGVVHREVPRQEVMYVPVPFY